MDNVGYLPEQPHFYDYLTGKEFLNFIARIYGIDRSIQNKRAMDSLNIVGLRNKANQRIRSYSRGMVQRLGLAQVLINDPSLMILDEPMSTAIP